MQRIFSIWKIWWNSFINCVANCSWIISSPLFTNSNKTNYIKSQKVYNYESTYEYGYGYGFDYEYPFNKTPEYYFSNSSKFTNKTNNIPLKKYDNDAAMIPLRELKRK